MQDNAVCANQIFFTKEEEDDSAFLYAIHVGGLRIQRILDEASKKYDKKRNHARNRKITLTYII